METILYRDLKIVDDHITDGEESYHIDECDCIATTAWKWSLDMGASFEEADAAEKAADTYVCANR